MSTQITEYKCPNCTGPLHFVGESGKLECDYCGTSYEVSEIEAFCAEAEQKAEAAFAESQAKPEETAWDLSDISDGWGADKSGFSGKNGKF